MKAKLGKLELEELTRAAPDPWALCSFMEGYRRASEMEYMITETLHAAKKNVKDHGEPFSFRGAGVFTFSGGGLADNGTAYGQLLDQGFFMEEIRPASSFQKIPKDIKPDSKDAVTVIFLTEKLVRKLRNFLKIKTA